MSLPQHVWVGQFGLDVIGVLTAQKSNRVYLRKKPCDRISFETRNSDTHDTETFQALLSDQNILFGYLYFISICIEVQYEILSSGNPCQ